MKTIREINEANKTRRIKATAVGCVEGALEGAAREINEYLETLFDLDVDNDEQAVFVREQAATLQQALDALKALKAK